MRLLHVIPSINPIFGGPSKMILDECDNHLKHDIVSEIATTHFAFEKQITNENIKIHSFPSYFGKYKYSHGLKKWLKNNIKNYDMVHIHSLYCYSTHTAARVCVKNKIPYVIMPHGSLSVQNVHNKSYLKKLLIYLLYDKKSIENANSLQFTTKMECEDSVLKKENHIIPNGVNPETLKTETHISVYFPELAGKKFFLYLARIYPMKRLELLLNGIKNVLMNSDYFFVIAGSGDKQYVKKIKKEVEKLGLNEKVVFTSHVSGDKKNVLLKNAECFLLSSNGDNFGIAIIEAMAAGLPVLISDKVGISEDILKYDAGIVFSLTPTSINDALDKFLKNPELKEKITENAKKLVNDKYLWDKITEQQMKVYEEIIEGNKNV